MEIELVDLEKIPIVILFPGLVPPFLTKESVFLTVTFA
jgi:hypothetical protein